jgi:hypothetical protein
VGERRARLTGLDAQPAATPPRQPGVHRYELVVVDRPPDPPAGAAGEPVADAPVTAGLDGAASGAVRGHPRERPMTADNP